MLIASLVKNKSFKIAAIIVICVIVVFAAASVLLLSPKSFYKGLRVEGVDIGGLSRHDAAMLLEDRIDAYLEGKSIGLKYKDTLWTIKPKDISLSYNLDDTLKQSYDIGRQGNIFKRVFTVLKLRFEGQNLILLPRYDKAMLHKLVSSIKKQVDKEGKDASITYDKEGIKISKEVIGIQIDIDKNINLIENHIRQDKFGVTDLILAEKKPDILYENIKEIDTVLSSFSTVFNPNDANRTRNLKLSCDRIDGMVLLPGEVFSMNETLGPRTLENGYKEAKIIVKSEYVNGVGGGVCQISTTLYDAVLLSRLKVVERAHHSLPSVYVSPGQDATIAENYLDFKFKNDRDYPIGISAELVNNKVTIRILGKEGGDAYTVKLVSDIVEEYPPLEEEILIDDEIPDDKEVFVQHPRNGCRVIVYRELYNSDGELVEREKISEDVYKPIKAQIKVNQNHEKAKIHSVMNN